MFTRHVPDELAALIDGQLTAREAERAEGHLRNCARCRAGRDDVKSGIAMMEGLPLMEAPETIWPSIEQALVKEGPERAPARVAWGPPRWGWVWAYAIAAFLACAGVAYWWAARGQGQQWELTRTESGRVAGHARIRAGEWIETQGDSRASIRVGEIGSVEVAPNSRVRVVTARPDEHRIALVRGEIHAAITAPPRLFFVDTPSGTAVDLGCEYTLRAGDDGFGMLRVSRGWVSFQSNGLESLVPAGASCATRTHGGPGMPYFDDAPKALIEALERFTFEGAGPGALGVILASARVRDTLTLWHLLSRVDAADRGSVYDRMAALTPVPAGVLREKVLQLDAGTLSRWREELAWTW